MKKKKNHKPENQITQPVFAGGKKALEIFIKSELRYPEEALNNKLEGVVKVGYDVDVFGKVSNVHIIKGIGYGCDEEAIRLVKLLSFPRHKYPGMHVVFHQIININFRIVPSISKPQSQQQIVYTLQPSTELNKKNNNAEKDKIPSQKISYSIVNSP